MNDNKPLHRAKREAFDEFYTQTEDIEMELSHYNFDGQTIYCNCDNPYYSNFFNYFDRNFNNLKCLIATGIDKERQLAFKGYRDNKKFYIASIPYSDGLYNSGKALSILVKNPIVITNPPFSLFRDYIKTLIELNAKFLVMGNLNAITYKEVYTYIQQNRLWLGYNNREMTFEVPNNYDSLFPDKPCFKKDGQTFAKIRNIGWFTNLEVNKPFLELTNTNTDYPKYDNFDAIDIPSYKLIPKSYKGVMGVPITFLLHHNRKQFEIVKFRKGNDGKDLSINGKCPYFRILIKSRI